jgi:hypothetical protein
MRDKIIQQVVEKFQKRSDVGYKKYGITLHDDVNHVDVWLTHLQEELMDAVNYIEKLKTCLTEDFQEQLLKQYNEEKN